MRSEDHWIHSHVMILQIPMPGMMDRVLNLGLTTRWSLDLPLAIENDLLTTRTNASSI